MPQPAVLALSSLPRAARDLGVLRPPHRDVDALQDGGTAQARGAQRQAGPGAQLSRARGGRRGRTKPLVSPPGAGRSPAPRRAPGSALSSPASRCSWRPCRSLAGGERLLPSVQGVHALGRFGAPRSRVAAADTSAVFVARQRPAASLEIPRAGGVSAGSGAQTVQRCQVRERGGRRLRGGLRAAPRCREITARAESSAGVNHGSADCHEAAPIYVI